MFKNNGSTPPLNHPRYLDADRELGHKVWCLSNYDRGILINVLENNFIQKHILTIKQKQKQNQKQRTNKQTKNNNKKKKDKRKQFKFH